jgi:hypothetical protein
MWKIEKYVVEVPLNKGGGEAKGICHNIKILMKTKTDPKDFTINHKVVEFE